MNEQKFLYQSDTPSKTIYDRAMNYLDEKYNIRFNTIALELEIQLKEQVGTWTVLNINSLLIELAQSGIEINDDKAWLLNNPWGLQMARLVTGGEERIVKDKTDEYKRYWYTNYKLESVVALQELLETSMDNDLFAKVKQPTLMLYYYKNEQAQDPVVKVSAMLNMFEKLGTPPNQKEKVALPNTENHVIGSSITSKDVPSVENAIHKFTEKHYRLVHRLYKGTCCKQK